MSIEFGIWRIDAELRKLTSSRLDQENRLEDVPEHDISILGLDVMTIGRQSSLTTASALTYLGSMI